jgi:hypothetical protein
MSTLSHDYTISVAALLARIAPALHPYIAALWQEELEAYLARAAPEARPDIIDLYTEWKTTPVKAFSRPDSGRKGSWGQTVQIEKEKSGVLRTVRNGKRVLTTAASLFPHLIERVIAAYPAGSKPRRQPTPQELDGLRRANAARHAEAQARKEGKQVSTP